MVRKKEKPKDAAPVVAAVPQQDIGETMKAQAETKKRVEKCSEEIAAVLKKHDCVLVARPMWDAEKVMRMLDTMIDARPGVVPNRKQ